MTSKVLYQYHAPDDRIYGPVDYETLQRWEKEGRIIASSRLRSKGETTFTTWETVRQIPPSVEPEPLPAPLPMESPEPLPIVAPSPPAPFPSTMEIVRHSTRLYAENFWPLFFYSAALHLMVFIMTLVIDIRQIFPHLPHLNQNLSVLVKCTILIFSVTLLTSAPGVLSCLLDARQRQEKWWFANNLEVLKRIFLPTLLSLFPRMVLPILAAIPAMLTFACITTLGNKIPGILLGILPFVGLVLLVPPFLLTLRLLLTPQVMAMEESPVIAALKRSHRLVTYNSGKTAATSGEFKLFSLLLIYMVLTLPFFLVYVQFIGHDPFTATTPVEPKLLNFVAAQLIMFIGNTLIDPLYAAGLYLYYQHSSAGVEEA